MTYEECRDALRTLPMFIPKLGVCNLCGHEHRCDVNGCAILREALAIMEQLHEDASDLCDTCVSDETPVTQEPCDSCKCCDPFCAGGISNWQWRGVIEPPTSPPTAVP